jgi:hypothetical protein
VRSLALAFVLGAVAIGIVASVAGFAVGVAAQAGGWPSFRVGLGPLVLFAFTSTARATTTTFGAGLPALAVLGGLVNAGAARVLSRRRG